MFLCVCERQTDLVRFAFSKHAGFSVENREEVQKEKSGTSLEAAEVQVRHYDTSDGGTGRRQT